MEAQKLAFPEDLLWDDVVVEALGQAWFDSKPGPTGGSEEGGFVVEDDNGDRYVARWETGSRDGLTVPPHDGCRVGGRSILASFHTHPNTGNEYRQDPSGVDVRSVTEDPDLKQGWYLGEFIVSQDALYLIGQSGEVVRMGETRDILGSTEGF